MLKHLYQNTSLVNIVKSNDNNKEAPTLLILADQAKGQNHHLTNSQTMTPQTYTPLRYPATAIEPTDAEWPSLSDAIEHLQNLELTSMAIARRDPVNYHLLRSVEILKQEMLDAIGRLDPEWLELIGYPEHEAYRPDLTI